MVKLVLEKAEEPEIKWPTSAGSLKKQESSRKKYLFLLYWLCQSLWVWITINWKILKEMGIPDHLTCLLRNLYADQEATLRTGHGTTDWFQIGKGIHQGCILSPCLSNLHGEYIMRNAELEEAQAEIRIAGRNIKSSDMQMTPALWQKWRRAKEPLDESERGDWKSWLKAQHSENMDQGIRSQHFERLLLNHTKMSGFMASGGEEFNPRLERRLDHSELLCNKVLLKYKEDRESFWHRHQQGAERVPPC